MAVTLVTGANRGLGLELTRQLAERGDTVFATARNPEKAKALSALHDEHDHRVHVLPLDVADDQSILKAARAVARKTETLDLLVNNAGIIDSGDEPWNSDVDPRLGELRRRPRAHLPRQRDCTGPRHAGARRSVARREKSARREHDLVGRIHR
ncbi:MAG: SDR family NAD(P)-dependent oxidoreductase [Deltaproteobacteria bacterium]|nr:SDR family NAD(P)-dependent oxidoreductase [Deltaproteobacteria bacterium]